MKKIIFDDELEIPIVALKGDTTEYESKIADSRVKKMKYNVLGRSPNPYLHSLILHEG